jgi:hypothetical protein
MAAARRCRHVDGGVGPYARVGPLEGRDVQRPFEVGRRHDADELLAIEDERPTVTAPCFGEALEQCRDGVLGADARHHGDVVGV